MKITRQDIARGYEPVANLDTKVMASRQALTKMNFPTSEIDKMDVVAKERKYFVERSKELAKLSKKRKPFPDILFFVNVTQSFLCGICGHYVAVGIAETTSIEQETKIPSCWALLRFESANHKAFIAVPPGIVIDYEKAKVYMVCGTCQLLLDLRSTESGILIHNITKGTGYGFVDLDRVEGLIQEHKK